MEGEGVKRKKDVEFMNEEEYLEQNKLARPWGK